MPLGGYKGTGLAVMVEILCAVLSGGAMLTEVGGIRVHRISACARAIFFWRSTSRDSCRCDDFIARMTADARNGEELAARARDSTKC